MKHNPSDYPLTLFYDGACPVCRLEMDKLRERDGLRRLAFVDIAGQDFNLQAQVGDTGVTLEDMRRLIHARRPDGTMVVGVEVLQLAYTAIGWGIFAAPAGLPVLKPLFERAYAAFARNRHGISAVLGPLIVRMEAARGTRRTAACSEGACDIPDCRSNS